MKHAPQIVRDDEDLHQLANGRYILIQKKNGFKISQESILLARSLLSCNISNLVDLGAGCGIIALLAAENPAITEIHGLEIQPDLVELAQRNVALNGLTARVTISLMDVRTVAEHFPRGSFAAVVSNPPFRGITTGTRAEQESRRKATQEFTLEMKEVITAAYYLLKHKGLAAFVYAPDRLIELLQLMRRGRLEPKQVTFVHHHRSHKASAVLVHGKANARPGLEVRPPIFTHELPILNE